MDALQAAADRGVFPFLTPVCHFQRPHSHLTPHRRRRRGGAGGHVPPPPKIWEKYFYCNYYVKFGHFLGKYHVKFGNFANFSDKYHKNSGILVIFGQESCKILAFCHFFIHIFSGKMSCPIKLTELLRPCL